MFTKTTSLFALLLSTGLVLALPVDQASKAVDARPPVRKIEVSTKGWKREEPEVDAGEWAANYRIPVNRKDWAETTAEEDGAGTRAWSTVHRPVTSEKRDWASAEKSTDSKVTDAEPWRVVAVTKKDDAAWDKPAVRVTEDSTAWANANAEWKPPARAAVA